MSKESLHFDVAFRSVNFHGEAICGDSVVVRRCEGGQRTILVLSDGMGHGVKANILSTLTSSMLVNMLQGERSVVRIASMILRTLPVCSVRKLSYSTFTLIDMDSLSGEVSIAQYDNPDSVLLRAGEPLALEWEIVETPSSEGRVQRIKIASFQAMQGDRIVAVSDGVTQSGQRTQQYRFGWGADNLREMVTFLASYNTAIDSGDLASQVVSRSVQNDDRQPSDDMTCVAIGVRATRQAMLISCPPALNDDHVRLVSHIKAFEGRKMICGYHVAEIIATQLGLNIQRSERSEDPSSLPEWRIPTFDQVTDGLVTSSRVLNYLETGQIPSILHNPAARLTRTLLDSDRIEMVIGTMRNPAKGEFQADEFELRRNILSNIARLLETKYDKILTLTYI